MPRSVSEVWFLRWKIAWKIDSGDVIKFFALSLIWSMRGSRAIIDCIHIGNSK
jgi:hypothetical protein